MIGYARGSAELFALVYYADEYLTLSNPDARSSIHQKIGAVFLFLVLAGLIGTGVFALSAPSLIVTTSQLSLILMTSVLQVLYFSWVFLSLAVVSGTSGGTSLITLNTLDITL